MDSTDNNGNGNGNTRRPGTPGGEHRDEHRGRHFGERFEARFGGRRGRHFGGPERPERHEGHGGGMPLPMRVAMGFGGPGRGPGRGGGPGFGPGGGPRGGGPFRGGPFEGGRFGGGFDGPPFRRGHKAGRGDVRTAALSLLAEQPLHGYQIIQQIAERSGGVWRPSAGSVYPMLQQLADEGIVRMEESDGRRVFHLTEAGQAHVAERRDDLAAVWDAMNDATDDGLRELRDLIAQVGVATMQVAQAGSPNQIAAAWQALAGTRRQLYRILAEDESAREAPPTSETTPSEG